MKKRIITAVALTAFLVIALLLRQYVHIQFFNVFIALISTLAAYEISSVIQKKQVDKNGRAPKLVLFAPPVFAIATYFLFLGLSVGNVIVWFLPLLFALVLVFGIYIYFASDINGQGFKLNFLAIVYPTVLFAFFYLINHFAYFKDNLKDLPQVGLFAIVLTFVVVAFTDTTAMFGGMIFKGPKLIPSVSPKKTISGAVCGLVAGVAGAIITFVIFNTNSVFKIDIFQLNQVTYWHFIFIGLALSFLTQVGDLVESFLKRKLGIKDMGRFLPGHGGIMDRLDGASLAVVGTFLTMIFLFVV